MREADVSIRDSEFEPVGLGEFVSLCRDAGLKDLVEIACHGNGGIELIFVETPLDEQRLETLECVSRWERVNESEESIVYLIEFDVPDLSDTLATYAEELVCEPSVTEQGVALSLAGSHEAICGTLTEYERAGMNVTLRKLSEYGGRRQLLDVVTNRQREVLQTAHEMGYYEVPRQVSTTDIAEALAVDPSTVAEHLQRAERNLMNVILTTD